MGSEETAKKPGTTGLKVGDELPGGWQVTEQCGPEKCGRHSFGYHVRNKDGRHGFLKALNYDAYLLSPNPADVLKAALDAFHDENRLLSIARDKNLDRVIRLYTGDTVRTADGRGTCSYLIFELADTDGRAQFDVTCRKEYFECVTMLHDVAVGLWQLHQQMIAHQDIRAANILSFPNRRAKIGDLGRAVDPRTIAEHVSEIVPGDETYAPPELLYNSASPDWAVRRFGADIYLLGSLIVTFFMGTGMTPQMMKHLPRSLGPAEWNGAIYADVLPYLHEAAARVFQELQDQLLVESDDKAWTLELMDLVKQLCNPDPTRRGDPIARRQNANPFSLERYLAKLDRLTKQAQYLRKKSA